MKPVQIIAVLCSAVLVPNTVHPADPAAARKPREALQAFNDLIGSWRGTGTPEGTLAEKRRGFWTEGLTWEWRLKGDDAWLHVVFDKGKHFRQGDLRYLPDKEQFQLTATTPTQETRAFTGPLKDRHLTLERVDGVNGEVQRLTVHLLHANRFVYRYEVKTKGRAQFARVFQVGVTKEGEPFAGPADAQPECIVSGGRGTSRVTYRGKEYYVCCGGCRTAFQDDPEKFIKEYEAKKKASKGKD